MTPPIMVAVTGGMRLGGSTTFLLNLGRAWQERGATLPILCMAGENEMAVDFAAAGIPVHVLEGRGLIYEDRILRTYARAASHHPAAVLACLSSESFELLRLAPPNAVRLGIIQSDDPGVYRMARNYTPWMDGMVGVSETICARLREDSAYEKIRVEYIPYGIHFGGHERRKARSAGEPLRIIYLGRMAEEQKRVSRLVELARELAAREGRFEFTFAGTGSELEVTRDALRGVAGVRFLGDVANHETAKLLRSQDVYVLLSDYEGLPLSLLEAMGQGVVPVVSDLESGIRNVVTPQTGVRTKVGDVTAAAAAIAALAREPERLAALSAACVRLAREEFTAARMAERYSKLIAELSRGFPEWPAKTKVPSPLLLRRPWLYQGFPRRVRRLLKKLRV